MAVSEDTNRKEAIQIAQLIYHILTLYINSYIHKILEYF